MSMRQMDVLLQGAYGIYVWHILKREKACTVPYVILGLLSFTATFSSGENTGFMTLVPVLLGVCLVDIGKYIIPDELVLIIIFNRLLYLPDIGSLRVSLCNGAFIFVYILVLSKIVEVLFKKEMMGGGDLKLYSALSMYQGISLNILCIILSCLMGLLWMAVSKRKKIPFGPCICISYLFVKICALL